MLSKTPRKLDLHWGQYEPVVDDGGVPVWVRDEWSASESAVRKAAAEAGDESPIVFAFLPRQESDRIRDTLATHVAAEETLHRPVPQTDGGRAARQAMASRRDRAEEEVIGLFGDVVARARVFQGGGTELTTTSSLRDSVETAASRSLIRLFPKFAQGDNPNWGKVLTKARDGAPDALTAVGHHGEPTTHPVCKEVLAAISPGGTKGADLQKRFAGPPFGWPKDAVNGAVLVLLAAGNIRAAQDGKDLGGPKELPQTQIGKVTLYKEDAPPTRAAAPRRARTPDRGRDLLRAGSGGSAAALRSSSSSRTLPPAPAVRRPFPKHRTPTTSTRCWRSQETSDSARSPTTTSASAPTSNAGEPLQHAVRSARPHGATWNVCSATPTGCRWPRPSTPAVAAIRDGRQLLDEPDPIAPLLTELVTALRAEVTQRAQQLADAQRAAVAGLEAWPEWNKLDPADRDAIVAEAKLGPCAAAGREHRVEAARIARRRPPQLRGPTGSRLVDSRRDQARQRAAKKLEPKSVEVKPPSATFKPGDDPAPYFDQLRALVQSHLDAGTTVII